MRQASCCRSGSGLTGALGSNTSVPMTSMMPVSPPAARSLCRSRAVQCAIAVKVAA
jgi:hypothetical protein